MRSSAQARTRIPASARSTSIASLSVVVVASGSSAPAPQLADVLGGARRDLGAQLILVSQDPDPALAATFERVGAEFVTAPAGSTRAEMCDLGMSRASGAIVAVRDAIDVSDAKWLEAYRGVLPAREAAAPVPVESVVMDSMVAGKRAVADAPIASFGNEEHRSRVAAIEMAAAV